MNWFLPKTSSQTCCSRMHTCSISVARCLWVSSGRRKRCHAPSGSSSSLADEDRPPPPRPRLRFLFFLGLDLGLGGGRVEARLRRLRLLPRGLAEGVSAAGGLAAGGLLPRALAAGGLAAGGLLPRALAAGGLAALIILRTLSQQPLSEKESICTWIGLPVSGCLHLGEAC